MDARKKTKTKKNFATFTGVFPKIDHSARSDRIVLVEYTIGSVVELNFCLRNNH